MRGCTTPQRVALVLLLVGLCCLCLSEGRDEGVKGRAPRYPTTTYHTPQQYRHHQRQQQHLRRQQLQKQPQYRNYYNKNKSVRSHIVKKKKNKSDFQTRNANSGNRNFITDTRSSAGYSSSLITDTRSSAAYSSSLAVKNNPTIIENNDREDGSNNKTHKATSTFSGVSGAVTTTPEGASQGVVSRRGSNAPTPPYTSLYEYVCPPEFLQLGNGCYYMSKDMHDWQTSHFECRDRDSQLALIGSQWEDRTLRSYLNSHEMTRLNRWLGGIYDWSQEEWVWGSSGAVMKYKGFLTKTRSPHSPRWKCAFVAPSLFYRWNYTKCTDKMHYMCETGFKKVRRRI